MGWEKKRVCCQRSAACSATLRDQSVYTCLPDGIWKWARGKTSIKAFVVQPHFKANTHMWRQHVHPPSLSVQLTHKENKSFWTGAYKHKIDVTKRFCFQALTSSWHVISGTVWSFVGFFSHLLFFTTLTFYWTSVSAKKNTSGASWNVWNAVIS